MHTNPMDRIFLVNTNVADFSGHGCEGEEGKTMILPADFEEGDETSMITGDEMIAEVRVPRVHKVHNLSRQAIGVDYTSYLM